VRREARGRIALLSVRIDEVSRARVFIVFGNHVEDAVLEIVSVVGEVWISSQTAVLRRVSLVGRNHEVVSVGSRSAAHVRVVVGREPRVG